MVDAWFKNMFDVESNGWGMQWLMPDSNKYLNRFFSKAQQLNIRDIKIQHRTSNNQNQRISLMTKIATRIKIIYYTSLFKLYFQD